MIGSIGFDPFLINLSPLQKEFLCDFGMAAYRLEEIDDLIFALQAGQMAIDDDSIKAMINPLQAGSEKV